MASSQEPTDIQSVKCEKLVIYADMSKELFTPTDKLVYED